MVNVIIKAIVIKVSDDEVTIDFGDNVNIRAVKTTLAHVKS